MTTHERRPTTLACLEALEGQRGQTVEVDVFLCDAGSTDGTPEAVRERFPRVNVLERGPDLFWNAGMRVAWAHARHQGGFEAYLWLNDDTILDPDALARLEAGRDAVRGWGRWPAILVGAARDPDTGETTYSGMARTDPLRPMRLERVDPTGEVQPVDTMNGNLVLVPTEVAERVGNLDARFEHAIGDNDYGFRARHHGFEILLLPGTFGTCPRNPPAGERSVAEEWRALRGPKGLPPAQWVTFVRRWGGPLWPVYAVSPYVRRLVRRLLRDVTP